MCYGLGFFDFWIIIIIQYFSVINFGMLIFTGLMSVEYFLFILSIIFSLFRFFITYFTSV